MKIILSVLFCIGVNSYFSQGELVFSREGVSVIIPSSIKDLDGELRLFNKLDTSEIVYVLLIDIRSNNKKFVDLVSIKYEDKTVELNQNLKFGLIRLFNSCEFNVDIDKIRYPVTYQFKLSSILWSTW